MDLSLHVTISQVDSLNCNKGYQLVEMGLVVMMSVQLTDGSCSSMQTFHADVNECDNDGLNHCHEDASCTNTEESFNCSCNDGYSGSGTECTGS